MNLHNKLLHRMASSFAYGHAVSSPFAMGKMTYEQARSPAHSFMGVWWTDIPISCVGVHYTGRCFFHFLVRFVSCTRSGSQWVCAARPRWAALTMEGAPTPSQSGNATAG